MLFKANMYQCTHNTTLKFFFVRLSLGDRPHALTKVPYVNSKQQQQQQQQQKYLICT